MFRARAIALVVAVFAVKAALLRKQRACSGTDAALQGAPTHYRPSGCWRASSVEDRVDYGGSQLVSHEACFAFCASTKGAHYFGVAEGHSCWCGSIWNGDQLDDGSCDEACPGNDLQTCGGIDATNIFVMYDCTPASVAETATKAAAENAELVGSYGAFTGQTCGLGEDSAVAVGGAETKVGSLDDCKLACWKASKAEKCHGFTYSEDGEKCTFSQDVLDGDVEYKPRTTCYFKMI